MFPKDAHFICRKCLEQFSVKASEFRTLQKTGALECPACGQTGSYKEAVSDFFKHYPRLTNMIHALEIEGVRMGGRKLDSEEILEGNVTRYWIHGVEFNCVECGQLFCTGTNENWPVEAGDFNCPDCGINPRVVIMKEFRTELGHVDLSQMRLCCNFQFDLFSPWGIDPLGKVKMLLSGGLLVPKEKN